MCALQARLDECVQIAMERYAASQPDSHPHLPASAIALSR